MEPLYRPYSSTFLPVSLNGNLSTDLTGTPSYLWVSMASSLQTLQHHLPTCESQWQPLYRPYSTTFLPVSLNGNISTDLTAPPSYLWVSMATFLQRLWLHLPTCESQWQHLHRPYSSTFLPVSLNDNISTELTPPPSYLWVSMATSLKTLQHTFLPVSLNGNLSTDLTAPPSYLWVSMETSPQTSSVDWPTNRS